MNEPLEPTDVYDSTHTTVFDRARLLASRIRSRTSGLRTRLDDSTIGVRERAGEQVAKIAGPGGSVDRVEDFLNTRLEDLRGTVGQRADKAVDVAKKGVSASAELTKKSAEFITKRR